MTIGVTFFFDYGPITLYTCSTTGIGTLFGIITSELELKPLVSSSYLMTDWGHKNLKVHFFLVSH